MASRDWGGGQDVGLEDTLGPFIAYTRGFGSFFINYHSGSTFGLEGHIVVHFGFHGMWSDLATLAR